MITLQGPPQIAFIGTSATNGSTLSFSAAGLPDLADLMVTLTLDGDGNLHGSFTGSNADCPVLDGTITGTLPSTGSIFAAGAVETYHFVATAGDQVVLTLNVASGFDQPGDTLSATLVSPTGAQVGELIAPASAPFTLSETGTYLVRVTATQAATGTYHLGLICTPD